MSSLSDYSSMPMPISSMFCFTWTVDDFLQQNKKLESPTFSGHPLPGLKWRFIIYPYGDKRSTVAGDKNVSVYLQLVNGHEFEQLWISYKIGLLNSKNELVNVEEGEDDFMESNHKAWGWSCFVSRKAVEVSKGLLRKGQLTVRCEIVFSEETINQLLPVCETSLAYANLVKDISKLYMDRSTADVTINVHGKKLMVDKFILMTRSTVFKAMLASQLEETRTLVIDIDDFEFEVIEALVQFLYTAQVSKINTLAMELMKAADKYNLLDLKAICETHICNNLVVAPEDALSVLIDAILVNSEPIKSIILMYISESLEEVKKSESWHDMLPNPVFRVVVNDLIEEFRKKALRDCACSFLN